MGDYYDLFLKTDVFLLADVFETFQNTCLQQYGLDPAHCNYTSHGLRWDVLLKMTGVELELLTDYTMCTSSRRRGFQAVSPWSSRTMPRPTIWRLQAMTHPCQTHTFSTLMPTTSMVRQ